MEVEKQQSKIPSPEKSLEVKDQIADAIKNSEGDGGIDTEKLISRFNSVSSDIVKSEIQKLLEGGIIFEPRPGKLRWLG